MGPFHYTAAPGAGIEPAIFRLTAGRLTSLAILDRAAGEGIEPSTRGPEPRVLPVTPSGNEHRVKESNPA